MDIDQIVTTIETRNVTLAGTTYEARMLSAADESLIRVVHPAPEVPTKRDPSKGSRTDVMIRDPEDSGYIASFQRWSIEILAIKVAIMLGLEAGGLKWACDRDRGDLAKWCGEVSRSLLKKLRVEDLDAIYEAVHPDPRQLQEDARGN